MFQNLTLRGDRASLLWGYHTAAALGKWKIARNEAGQWMLSARMARVDAFQLRQRPLLFTAPRDGAHDGWWAWGVEGEVQVGTHRLVAYLGPPEQ